VAIAAAALVTAAGTLAKPSFALCLIPAVLSLAGLRSLAGRPPPWRALLPGLILPACVVLAWQYLLSYSGTDSGVRYQSTILFAPLRVLRFHAVDLGSKLVLSILFPLAVCFLYWPRSIQDTGLALGFLLFLFGAGYGFLLSETTHPYHANLLWSGHISLFILFAFAVLFYVRQLRDGPFRGRAAIRHLLALAILLLHVRSGILTEIAFLHAQLGQYHR